MTTKNEVNYVMLIDSHPPIAAQLQSLIAEPQVSVASTCRWQHALAVFLAGRLRLVICDLELPENGAQSFLAEVERHAPLRTRDVVFCRNVVTRPDAAFLPQAMRRSLIDKPFSRDQVQSVVLKRLLRPS